MPDENLNSQNTLPDENTVRKISYSKNNNKIIFSILLIVIALGALIFVACWYKNTKENNQQEGDEFQETDPNWKKTMENITPDPNEKTPWITFNSNSLINSSEKFSFSYPVNVFLESKNNMVFLDTKIFDLPTSWDGFLTPMQISVESKTATEKITSLKKILKPDSIETALTAPLKGTKIVGTWQGYPYDGEKYEEIIIQGTKNIIVISYLPSSFEGRFPQSLFDQIFTTFKLQ